jgi:hypothetical protein
MVAGKGKLWGLIALVVLVVLIAGGIVGLRVSVGVLKGKVVEALGPDSEVENIRVGWSTVDVEGLRIKGSRGWPAADTLRAERIGIVPSLRSVLSGQFRVHSITIVRPYLSALRTKNGQLQVVPSLLAGAGNARSAGSSAPAAAPAAATVGHITLHDGVLELFDPSVTQPPLKIRLEQIQATVRDVVVPALTGRTRFDLAGVLKGAQRDGAVTIAGWVEIATKDSSVRTTFQSVDLVALQPYVIKPREPGVRKGTPDLNLRSECARTG